MLWYRLIYFYWSLNLFSTEIFLSCLLDSLILRSVFSRSRARRYILSLLYLVLIIFYINSSLTCLILREATRDRYNG